MLSDSEARYEGSGGGSGQENTNTGGSGGGLIWMTASNIMNLQETSILSEGTNGIENGVGNGGGSGGSIQIFTSKL